MKTVGVKTAKLAREKGFDDSCEWTLEGSQLYKLPNGSQKNSEDKTQTAVPYQAQLQRWFREVHKLHINPVFSNRTGFYGVEMCKREGYRKECDYVGFGFKQPFTNSYEIALETGLYNALKLI